MEERETLRSSVPRHALDARVPDGRSLGEFAREVMAIARAGLTARNRLNASGDNETGFLETLDEIVASGRPPAQVLLDRYAGEWQGDIAQVYRDAF